MRACFCCLMFLSSQVGTWVVHSVRTYCPFASVDNPSKILYYYYLKRRNNGVCCDVWCIRNALDSILAVRNAEKKLGNASILDDWTSDVGPNSLSISIVNFQLLRSRWFTLASWKFSIEESWERISSWCIVYFAHSHTRRVVHGAWRRGVSVSDFTNIAPF